MTTPKFDVVLKAEHYNVHPSGIEAIHIVRCLNFDMGCALKYVMRRHGKEYERSLKSAEYYLRDQHRAKLPAVVDDQFYQLLWQYRKDEPVPLAHTVYRGFDTYLRIPDECNFEMLTIALSTLRNSGL